MTFLFSENEFIYGRRQGRKYIGDVGRTGSGEKCLNWDDQRVIETKKVYSKNNFPDNEIPGPFCRNPLDPVAMAYSNSPWCYFLNNKTKLVEFDYCSQLKVTGR